MRLKRWVLRGVLIFAATSLAAQITGDAIGVHDLSPHGNSPLKGVVGGACVYCHAPHSGIADLTPLWNQTLSTQTYTPYVSTTYNEKGNAQPPLGADSVLCLSCHDGTVAPGQTIVYHRIPTTGKMNGSDVFGTNLTSSHPFSLILPMTDSPDLVASLVSQGKTADPTGAVKLIKGNIECTTCHNPHVQGIDPINLNFLVRDSSRGQMCLACHDPNRIVTGKTNGLAGWTNSIHATASNRTANQPPVGGYATVSQDACASCHSEHNAAGAQRLLRGPNEQDCAACHSGGSNLAPIPPNIFGEYVGKVGHPFSTGNSSHDAAEPALLNQSRHSTCVDCHDAHATQQVGAFGPAPLIRASQNGVQGIGAADGISVVSPAVNQFENCLRCHGTSTGKTTNILFGYLPVWAVAAPDPLNVIPQFAPTSTSSHPVTHDRSGVFPQPSLRANMVQLNGSTTGRVMGSRIFCSDCHNSDDNREFGGTGPNGPHASKWKHILERRYEFSQAAVPGGTISMLYPNPDLSINGPYAMCAKCHDLNILLSNSSFTQHSRHIIDGFTCSTCHTSHGMGAASANISGERMVNFDINVVAPNGNTPISYNKATNSCTLTCHNHAHQGTNGGKKH